MPRFSNLYELPGSIRMNDANDVHLGDREALRVHRKMSQALANADPPDPTS